MGSVKSCGEITLGTKVKTQIFITGNEFLTQFPKWEALDQCDG